ncbi:precorrin-8X methylmutase [Archaeoglobus sulfaticallidus]|nr:precorrin-8X methylmutase [Archaeoglobus sulfaticallidus]
MYFGAETREAIKIARKSAEIARKLIPGDDLKSEILRRCVIATGDPSVKDIIRFKGAPEKGVEAIWEGCEIIVDVNMIKAGLRAKSISAMEFADSKSTDTRVVSGFKKLHSRIDGCLLGIGNSPSAAMHICEIAEKVRPAFIVATPVGFVNAAESKEMIRELDIPSITTVGTRGGSTICAAIINCLIDFARDRL